ncbi:MAG TPA: tyrosine-type recombinase/integrase [Bacteroidia bacterium]
MPEWPWLQERKKVGPEYAAKSIQQFKGIINYAIVNDYIKNNVFSSLRVKRGQKKNIEFLKPEELDKLKTYKFASERLQQVADLFLLQCFTGFSYSDLANFDPKFHVEKEENGREWIVKPRSKNGIESVLPFMPEAKEICMKYCVTTLHGKKLNLPVITNQKYNSYLKEIGEIHGFNITLTTHVGRKTFGTIALNKGYSIESVSKMLGHTNTKTTQFHYAVILKKEL